MPLATVLWSLTVSASDRTLSDNKLALLEEENRKSKVVVISAEPDKSFEEEVKEGRRAWDKHIEDFSQLGHEIFYEFLCKCDLFTGRFKVPRLTGIFTEEK